MSGKINNGKNFERMFKQSCEKQGILHINFDDSNKFGFGGEESKTRFTPQSICDCTIFTHRDLYLLELKTTIGGSISFNNPPDKKSDSKSQPMIKPHQVRSLLERQHFEDVYCGLILDYSDRETKTMVITGGTYYIPIQTFYDWAISCGKKSINVEDARLIGVEIERTLKKVNYSYDVMKMTHNIKEV